MALQTSTYCQNAWMYCYNFVGQASTIIENIAEAEGEESDRQFIEAQARTFRAHSDFKRWNLPLVKKAFKADDTTSGNCDALFAFTADVSMNNGWRLAIPQQEIDANPAIDRSLLK